MLESISAELTWSNRFGQAALAECEHCVTFDDFALYALPRPLLEYAREAFVVGFVTGRWSLRERWRKWGIAALVGGASFEAYQCITAPVIRVIAKDDLGFSMVRFVLLSEIENTAPLFIELSSCRKPSGSTVNAYFLSSF